MIHPLSKGPRRAAWRSETKRCACGERFWPTAGLTEAQWRDRVHCSRRCAALARWAHVRDERRAA